MDGCSCGGWIGSWVGEKRRMRGWKDVWMELERKAGVGED